MEKGPPPPPKSLDSLLGKAPTDLLVAALALGETAKARGCHFRSPEQDGALLALCTTCPGLMQNALKKAWLLGYGGAPPTVPVRAVQRKPTWQDLLKAGQDSRRIAATQPKPILALPPATEKTASSGRLVR